MRIDDSRGTFADILMEASPEVVKVAYQVRDLIQEVYPQVAEIPQAAKHRADYGVGLGQAREIFGYVRPMRDHVRLGFTCGATLPDPGELLEGTGKRLRYLKVYAMSDEARPRIRGLIESAVHERLNTPGLTHAR